MLPKVRGLRLARVSVFLVSLLSMEDSVAEHLSPIQFEAIGRASAATAPATNMQAPPLEELRSPTVPDTRPREYPAVGKALSLHLSTGLYSYLTRANAWVYVPRAFDPKAPSLHVVMLFHGHHNCLASYVSAGGRSCTHGEEIRTGYDIAAQVERSGTSAIVVVPQLAFDEASSDPGHLGKVGGLRAFLTELVQDALVPTIGPHRYADVDRVALMASSGGYEALLPALNLGQVDAIRDVYLLDAFYVETRTHEAFLRDHLEDFLPNAPHPRRFGMIFCPKSGTAKQSRRFGERAQSWMAERGQGAHAAYEPRTRHPELDDLRVPVAIYGAALEHDQVVSEYLWRFLAASEI